MKVLSANARALVQAKFAFLFAAVFLLLSFAASAQNAIVTENALAGNPASEWDISLAGDATIQGFGTDISVNKGQTIHFKINTDASKYTINIYRIGYYRGNGARKVGTGVITATLPQTQPAPLTDASSGLIDCGNWAESAHWDVPSTAVSGVYIAKLTRTDNGGSNHIIFIVRDDASTSDFYFKTSDATWQAYNQYGGNSLYGGTFTLPEGHAAKVSYNRPYITRGGGHGTDKYADFFFNAEYPMVRWMEANGYNVTYTTSLDADRRGDLIKNHKIFLSVGHDEYWSAQERTNVEAARNAGVNLAFFSGDEIYWKTRWEPSIDGTNTAYRTLVCYKEGTDGERACGGKCDPLPNVWTGLWRSGCEYPQADGCNPENPVSGQISWYSSYPAVSILVPDTYKKLRFWRNTDVANLGIGQTATLSSGTLGFEIDYEQNNGLYPHGRILLSETNVAAGIVHKMSMYKHSSGALVFGAGTIQWSWGLDGVHDGYTSSVPDPRVQQATVNLFADMGAQPASIQSGLMAATASTDKTPPVSIITAPVTNGNVTANSPVVISGTASDVGGVVAGVEVSVDGGVTWQVASGTTNWSYSWIPAVTGSATILVRSFDDSGNMEATGVAPAADAVVVNIGAAVYNCPCTVFQPTDVPQFPLSTNNQPLELGFKFRSAQDGIISAIRFYKGVGTTGSHSGHLWSSTGTLLGSVTFTESSAGWQQATFSSPIAVTANTTYLASIFSPDGYFAVSDPYFTQSVQNGPLKALANGEDGPNGLYQYSSTPAFPTQNYESSNYWVDVVFNTSSALPVIGSQPSSQTICATANATFTSSASGNPTPAVQWQVSSDGTTWTNISGATTATLTFVGALTDNGKQYRAAWTNSAGTVYSSAAKLTVNAPIAATVSKVNASCKNNDGSVAISATGGSSTYQYSINGTTFQTANVFNNLSAGTYTVTVKDALGCTLTVPSISIISASAVTASVYKIVTASCKGNDGSITILASGGASPYQYSINGGAAQSTSTFSNLLPGTYNITVVDNNSCTAAVNGVSVAKDADLTISTASKTDASCLANDGSITVTASGGVAPYLYTIDGKNFLSVNTLPNLAAGNYTITVKDSKGCTASTSVVSIAHSTTLAVRLSASTRPSCGSSNGSITVSGSGGSPSYQFSKDGVNYQTSNVFNSLSAGLYTLTVKDAKGCISTTTVALNSNSTLSASLYKTVSASCAGNDGSFTILATGGSPSYWYTMDANNYQTTGTFSNLSADTFNVGVVDAKYCVAIVSGIIITQNSPLTSALVAKTDASCTANDGSITVSATGGASPYLYTKDGVNYLSGGTFTGLAVGTYNITVKDARGCTSVVSGVTIAKTSSVTLSVASKTDAICTSSTGAVTINATGGVGPYLYSFNGGTYQSSNTFTGLTAGTYSITVKDSKGCSSVMSVTVNALTSSLAASLVSKSDENCTADDGSIAITATGGTAPYTFKLNGGSYQSSGTFSNLSAGTYTATAKDANGCTSSVSVALVSKTSSLSATVQSKNNASCLGNDGSIVITATGGFSPYQYSTDGKTFQTSNTLSNLSAKTYTVTVKDAKGCTYAISNIAITVASTINLSLASEVDVTCSGTGKDGSISVTASGGTTPYKYQLNGGTSQLTGIFTGLATGTYSVTVTDAKGCTKQLTGIQVDVNTPTAALASTTKVSCKGNDGSFTLTVSGGTPPYTYSVNAGNYVSLTNYTVSNLYAGTYYVTAKDSKGCKATVSGIVISKAATLTASASADGLSCKGKNDGSITVTASGGISPYEYSKDGKTYQTSNTFSDLAPGTYKIYVEDDASCSYTISNITVKNSNANCKKVNETNTATSGTTLEDVASSNEIRIMPNPSTTDFTLLVPYALKNKITIKVSDVFGRIVYKIEGSGNSQYTFGNHFAKGMYMVEVTMGEDKKVLKVIKQ